jgi:hypothetical protein
MFGIGHFLTQARLLLICNSGASSVRLAVLLGLACSAAVILARVSVAVTLQ